MTSVWHANSRLCRLRRETYPAGGPAAHVDGLTELHACLQQGQRCAQYHSWI